MNLVTYSSLEASFFASFLSLMSAAPIKRQISPKKAATTGSEPLRKLITSAPQLRGKHGSTENTVKAMKIMPRMIEIIINSLSNNFLHYIIEFFFVKSLKFCHGKVY